MNKVAAYLNEHLTGEVLTQGPAMLSAQQDNSVLSRRPEMIARPVHINDVRKIMRFCSQLAEKGHNLSVATRGYGTDITGAAMGSGIMIDMAAHLHRVMGLDPKQQLIHVQAGASQRAAQAALATHRGLVLPAGSFIDEDGTIGGALSSAAAGSMSAAYGTIGSAVQQLEVVLSNGDVLQTGRVSSRDLQKKRSLTTFEGEIYRQIDDLITDNQEVIAELTQGSPETIGYHGITRVREQDGSFDLTPLFIGAQGTLGIVSEVILKAEFAHPELSAVIAAYSTVDEAQNAVDLALKTKATTVELLDGRLFERAAQAGKVVPWAPPESYRGAVVIALFDTLSSRTRQKTAKKLQKSIELTRPLTVTLEEFDAAELMSVHAVLALAIQPVEAHTVIPRVFSGLWLPLLRQDSFMAAIRALEVDYGVAMPLFVDVSSGLIDIFPAFSAKKISDRQKILKLCADLVRLVREHEGTFVGQGGEGRLKASFIYPTLPVEERQLYAQIKAIFDPRGILAPGVKQEVTLKEVAAELNAWCRLQD